MWRQWAASSRGTVVVAGRSTRSLAVMKLSWKWSTAVLVTAALSACTVETPDVISADATVYREGRPAQTWQLTAPQLADLNQWLKDHRDGWNPSVVTYAPRLLYQLKAHDGSRWTLNVFPNTVVVVGERQYTKSFEPCDLAKLGLKTMIKCP